MNRITREWLLNTTSRVAVPGARSTSGQRPLHLRVHPQTRDALSGQLVKRCHAQLDDHVRHAQAFSFIASVLFFLVEVQDRVWDSERFPRLATCFSRWQALLHCQIDIHQVRFLKVCGGSCSGRWCACPSARATHPRWRTSGGPSRAVCDTRWCNNSGVLGLTQESALHCEILSFAWRRIWAFMFPHNV